MKGLEKFAFCMMLLPAASCALEDATPAVEQHGRALVDDSAPPCTTTWGEIKVTVRAGSIRHFDPCKLFDGITDEFAVIAGEGTNRTRLDIEFLENGLPVARTLTGFHTEVGGFPDMPASNRFEIIATCAESAITFPDYRGYANRPVALAFRSRCTASLFSILFWRDHYDGLEHIAELTPISYGAQSDAPGAPETPVTGDHFNLLSDTNVGLCAPSTVLGTANIQAIPGGALLGTVELHRSSCTRHPSGTPVDIYFPRAINAAGLPGELGSVHFQRTLSTGATAQIHESRVTTPSTGATSIRGNAFVDDDLADVASLRACARFYPTVTTLTGDATASGCTAWFALP